MHRFVLAEFNTHRAFSRNSASSRAIPVENRLKAFIQDPAWPVAWPREQPGMQGGSELFGDDERDARVLLQEIHDDTARRIRQYIDKHPDKGTRLHKSLLNRLMEPFQWHTVIVSSTEWGNFFAQRCHPDAQPEIRAAAEAMRDVFYTSMPTPVGYGDWHTPYVDGQDIGGSMLDAEEARMVSAARCARVSYLTHDGKRDPAEDLRLYERLVSANPPHWSPLEHVATPTTGNALGNFKGWHQLRHWSDHDH